MTRTAQAVLPLAMLALVGCGSMSDLDRPAYPPPPPPDPVGFDNYSAPTNTTQQAAAPQEFDDRDPSALTDFKPALDPHGSWVDDPTYGTVWVPATSEVGTDFAPYVTAGHWALDDNSEYTWVSDYDNTFGWVTFHYGRWVYLGNGWGWVPGRRYAPSWVTWRVGDEGYDYVGWAPMPPYYYWGAGGVAFGLAYYPPAPFMFCSSHYMFAHDVYRYRVNGTAVAEAGSHTHALATPGVGNGTNNPTSTTHALATPQHGPTAGQAHMSPSTMASAPHTSPGNNIHANYASPAAMGRVASSPSVPGNRGAVAGNRGFSAPNGGGPTRVSSGPSGYVSRGPAPGMASGPTRLPPSMTMSHSSSPVFTGPHTAAPTFSHSMSSAPSVVHQSAPSAPHYAPAPHFGGGGRGGGRRR